ncbi:MAG: hypothetical protein AB7L65_05780 [Hyphomonadaceae bacterium]
MSIASTPFLKKAFEQHLRNAASYRPFQQMSPLQIFEFFEARGYPAEFIDEAMKRIAGGGASRPKRKRTRSLRAILGEG